MKNDIGVSTVSKMKIFLPSPAEMSLENKLYIAMSDNIIMEG